MFESLESRQFFSVAVMGDASVAPAPATTDTGVVQKPAKKTEYLVVTLKEVFVTAVQTTPPPS